MEENSTNSTPATPAVVSATPNQIWNSPGARWIAASLALVGLVGIAYGPSFRGGFVWDDLVLVKQNPLASGEFNLRTVWLGADFSLSTVVLWLEWLVFHENAAGYRVVNAVLHCVSVLLLWRVLLRLRLPGAWLGAAVFAVHPVAVASVAWVSELKNTLSLPCFLLSGLAFLTYLDRTQAKPGEAARAAYWGALIAFILALLAKTSTVMLPVMLLGVIAWQQRVSRKHWVALVPFFALATCFGVMTIWFQQHGAIRGLTVQTGGIGERLADAGTAIWFYLGKAVFPVKLCAIYPGWEGLLPGLTRFLPLLLLLAALVVAGRYRKGWGRPILFGLGAFTVALLPVSGVIDMYFMVFSRVSDHFAYLPLVIIAGATGAGVGQIRNPRVAVGLALVVLAALAGLSQSRSRVYATDEALWRDTVQKNPAAWNAHNNLACNLAERGQLEAAMKHFEKSLEINPDNGPAHLNLAKGLVLTGRFAEAEPHFRRALEIKPEDAGALAAYGQALAENRRLEQAAEQLRKAVNLKPTAQTRLLLAALLAATGKHEEAASEYQQVLKIEPTSLEALNNLAWILATAPNQQRRNGNEAVRLAREACQLTSYRQPVMLGTLAAAFAEAGDFSNAVKTVQSAIDLASAKGEEAFAERNRSLLREYQAGRSYGLRRPGKNPNPR